MTLHKVTEEWLIKLEEKLHLVSPKNERIGKRTEDILSAVDEVRQFSVQSSMQATSSKNKPNQRIHNLSWWERFKLFLAHLFNK